MSKTRQVKDIPSGFGTTRTLREEIDAVVCASLLDYDQKVAALQKWMPRHEAVRILGADPKEEITLRDPIVGCGKQLFLVIEKRYFDKIVSGEKREEYRHISEAMPGRYTYKGSDGRRYLKPFGSIKFAVGYHRDRETAVVECTGIKTNGECVTFSLGRILEYNPKK